MSRYTVLGGDGGKGCQAGGSGGGRTVEGIEMGGRREGVDRAEEWGGGRRVQRMDRHEYSGSRERYEV